MTAFIITHSDFITLERSTFVLRDPGMNVVFVYLQTAQI